jgi:choline kinase
MKKEPSLVILAAGMATRYGSLKQIDGFGPAGETIIDYSIYDAIKAGFKKVNFIVKEDYYEDFKKLFDKKLDGKITTNYIFQDFNLERFGINKLIKRKKPWGTGHALICAMEQIDEPFCIINADDFYGYDAFVKMINFLKNEVSDNNFALMGYDIKKTLSDYGAVSRGIFKANSNGYLEQINERTKVYKNDVRVVYEENDIIFNLEDDAYASMNFWGFSPAIFQKTIELFKKFINHDENHEKAEFYIPSIAEALINNEVAKFKVLPTSSQWFGITYKEDKEIVQNRLDTLVKENKYPSPLF